MSWFGSFADPHTRYRKLSAKIVPYLAKTPVTANHITLAMALLTPPFALLFFFNNLWLNLAGIVATRFVRLLDFIDGDLARAKNTTSNLGRYLDNVYHSIYTITLYLALGFREYVYNNDLVGLLLAGAIIIMNFFTKTNFYYRLSLLKETTVKKKAFGAKLPARQLLYFLYSIPKRYLIWILLVFFLLERIDLFLLTYSIYFLFDTFLQTIIFSRFPEKSTGIQKGKNASRRGKKNAR